MFEQVIDADNPAEKNLAVDYLRAARGRVRVKIAKARSARADRLLSYYFPAVVKPFADKLRAMGFADRFGKPVTDRQVHGLLCMKLLRTPVVNTVTGEVWGQVFSTTEDLTDEQVSEFVGKAEAFVSYVMDQIKQAPPVSAGAA